MKTLKEPFPVTPIIYHQPTHSHKHPGNSKEPKALIKDCKNK